MLRSIWRAARFSQCVQHFSNSLVCFFFSGTVCSLHLPQHPSAVHGMRLPTLHVTAVAAQLNHLLRSLYELLHSELPEEEASRSEKGGMKSCAKAFGRVRMKNWCLKNGNCDLQSNVLKRVNELQLALQLTCHSTSCCQFSCLCVPNLCSELRWSGWEFIKSFKKLLSD